MTVDIRFFVTHCAHSQKASLDLAINKQENPPTHTTSVEPFATICPRIVELTNYSAEVSAGTVTSVTCLNTLCPFHELHEDSQLEV